LIPEEQIAKHPDFPWLSADNPEPVESLMHALGWLASGEKVTGVGPAGEGNMNLTLRVRTDRRSVILKQARPWVEKYDHIQAPWERVLYERRFYEWVAGIEGVADRMPILLGADAAARVLLVEDLGESGDYTDLYTGAFLTPTDISNIASYLRALRTGGGRPDPLLANRAMRDLNHQHIYVLPLSGDLDLPLDDYEPGLKEVTTKLCNDEPLARATREIGKRYLADGPHLLHGDMYPGSWLRTDNGPRVIDPEFCFFGDAEFDVAVTVAHLVMARQAPAMVRAFVDAVCKDNPLDLCLIARYAGVEIIRRLIGVAQLPIAKTTGWRAGLLHAAQRSIMSQSLDPLLAHSQTPAP
jgi:5-methylthioribose kinase